jgi:alpha,alpha-trehalase
VRVVEEVGRTVVSEVETRCTKRRDEIDAAIFDLDGVITQTARVHARAWKRMFDEYLEHRRSRGESTFEPFDIEEDYPRYLDGLPRAEGVRRFLESRGIHLPEGDVGGGPSWETIHGLGTRKNEIFLDLVHDDGVVQYDDTIAQIRAWRELGLKTAVISASRNCEAILNAAGLAELFDARVDGVVTRRRGLAGKPAPDVFLEAARELGVERARTAVFEDAMAGVEAARRGDFGLVVGVDRVGKEDALRQAGADLVVSDLRQLRILDGDPGLPSAWARREEIGRRLLRATVAVFLDYDGTLTPIVSRPEDATLSDRMRSTVRRLAARCPVAIVSGRDREVVADLVGIDGLVYAGSHGFDIAGPDGLREEHAGGRRRLQDLDRAERDLRTRLSEVEGAMVERKRYSIAVHWRNVPDGEVKGVERIVDEVLTDYPELKRGEGKCVYELRPDVDWDKGKAVDWLLEALDLAGSDVLPLYIGDDVTDEDAFRALTGRGIGIRVGGESMASYADYRLRDPEEVRRFLEWLEILTGDDSA